MKIDAILSQIDIGSMALPMQTVLMRRQVDIGACAAVSRYPYQTATHRGFS